MGLLQEQFAFSRHVALLLPKAFELGFEFSLGEVLRTPEQQAIYVQKGASQTSNSMHLKKLAIDLNLFLNGKLATAAQIKPLGVYWESLDPKNQWGGSWRGRIENGTRSFVDGPHFERQA
jgi:hypothetical protein